MYLFVFALFVIIHFILFESFFYCVFLRPFLEIRVFSALEGGGCGGGRARARGLVHARA